MGASAGDSEPLALLEQLIRCPSVTPDDAGCQPLISSRLQALGFHATPLPYGKVDNLWLRRGDSAPLLVLAGHTDVVAPGPRADWHSDPFVPSCRDGLLHGRGAVDMKGGLAAMVCAIERFLHSETESRGSLALLLSSDEEGAAQDGTRRVMRWLQEQSIHVDWCLIGEPSSEHTAGDQVRIGRRGSLTGILQVQGIQGHAAYPDRARNPIHALSGALAALCRQHWDDGNAHYPPTSLQIVDLHAGDGTHNVIPGRLDLVLNFRYGSASRSRDLQAAVETLLAEHEVPHTLHWQSSGEPFLSPAGPLREAVCQACQAITGKTPGLSTGGGTSDGRFIAPLGIEVIELGPVHSTAHQVNECVSVAELEILCRIYTEVLQRLLGRQT